MNLTIAIEKLNRMWPEVEVNVQFNPTLNQWHITVGVPGGAGVLGTARGNLEKAMEWTIMAYIEAHKDMFSLTSIPPR